jgi:hypothetical protein
MLAGVLGLAVALYYRSLGLALTHYDARGHLIVSRRIFDSITPGWEQIGAVWLPLPHLLNALPIQNDWLYRTGTFAIALNIVCFAVSAGAIAWMVRRLTGVWWPALAAVAVFALNPNVLYLQSTAMTEPLLTVLLLVAVALLMNWIEHGTRPTLTGWMFALACLTRYEAWPVAVTAMALAVWTRWRPGRSWLQALYDVIPIAVYPAGAIVGFTIFSKIVIGSWFASGFFVPGNPAQGNPFESAKEILWGVRALSGWGLLFVGLAGITVLLARGRRHDRASLWLPLSLLATSAVPLLAFFDGHPYRIRYMIPLLAPQAIAAGVAVGSIRRFATLGSLALLALLAVELRPLADQAPMVLEAQWDKPNIIAREEVSACLSEGYQGDTVLASMGSLGHYMQNLAAHGLGIHDFLHEGNGVIWRAAMDSPRPYAGWILIEEKAEGGDLLAQRVRSDPHFLDGYDRVCEAAGVTLYRRQPPPM